jgi:hypothetical protein
MVLVSDSTDVAIQASLRQPHYCPRMGLVEHVTHITQACIQGYFALQKKKRGTSPRRVLDTYMLPAARLRKLLLD